MQKTFRNMIRIMSRSCNTFANHLELDHIFGKLNPFEELSLFLHQFYKQKIDLKKNYKRILFIHQLWMRHQSANLYNYN